MSSGEDWAVKPRPTDAESVWVKPLELGGPVDLPDEPRTLYGTVTDTQEHDRRPIIPAWLRNPDQRREFAHSAVGWLLYLLALHTLYSPWYLTKTCWYAPKGAARLISRQLRWWWQPELFSMLQTAASVNSLEGARTGVLVNGKLWQGRANRGYALLAELVGVGVASSLLLTVAPAWAPWAALAVVVVMLARFGRPANKPIVSWWMHRPGYVRLTAEMTRKALVATGKVKAPEDVEFDHDIHKDGPGRRAVVTLPDGVIATDVIDRREQLAGGFRLPLDQVWPSTVSGEHPGVLEIWVADRPVSKMKHPRSPLLAPDYVGDYFQPFPYGFDTRINPIRWALDERNSLFGGIPGSGKSLAARNVLLGAVLDPLVIPVISELAGKGDFEMFERLCPDGMYVCGADDGSIEDTLRIIEWLDEICDERGPLVAKYARQGMNNVKRVNRRMADHDERLRPVVAIFDEVQEFFSSPWGIPKGKSPPNGAGTLMSVIKRSRALGIHTILATQRFDKDSCPKAISSLVANRSALSVPAQPETDMILGTSSYRAGARPTAFVPGDDAGWMIRAGFRPGFETVRATFIDDNAAAAICRRALELRNGQAAKLSEPVRGRLRNLLADVREVWPHSEDALWSELIVPMLQRLDPEIYGDLTVEIFGARMARAGVTTVQIGRRIDGRTVNRKGVDRKALDRALEATSHGPAWGLEGS